MTREELQEWVIDNLIEDGVLIPKYGREKYFSKEYPEIYTLILKYTDFLEDVKLSERLYCIFSGISEIPKCEYCGNDVKFGGRFSIGYNRFCSPRCNGLSDETQSKFKKSCKERLGVEYPGQSEIVKFKKSKTDEIRYGGHHLKNAKVRNQIGDTMQSLYGKRWYSQTDKFKQDLIDTYNETYGCDHHTKIHFTEEQYRLLDNLDEIYNLHISEKIPITVLSDKLGFGKSYLYSIMKDRYKFMDYLDLYYNDEQQYWLNNLDKLYERHITEEIPVSVLSTQLGFSSSLIGKKFFDLGYKVKRFNKSYQEKMLSYELTKLNIEHETNDFTTIYPMEIDIFIREYNIGIEITGKFWHKFYRKSLEVQNKKHNKLLWNNIRHKTTKRKTKRRFHIIEKFNIAKDKGIRILNFYDHEINYKMDIVKSIILNVIGKIENEINVDSCIIKEISIKDVYGFYETNHIQGGIDCEYNYGLYYNDELVSCLSIGFPMDNNWKERGYLEVVRFCNILNTNVIGSFSKLLEYYLTVNNSKLIIFVDRRIFDGLEYINNGFKIISESKPNLYYFKGDKMYSRLQLKDLVGKELTTYDENLSDYENMKNNGWYRIYDCGDLVLEFTP